MRLGKRVLNVYVFYAIRENFDNGSLHKADRTVNADNYVLPFIKVMIVKGRILPSNKVKGKLRQIGQII